MEIDIEEFDHVNHAHLRDANNLLDLIIDDNGYEFGLVMDLGCGSGRVTSLIDCRLRCEQIVAIDIDMKAIKYARVNFSSPRIRYQVQDISVPWEQLDPNIQSMEGKVGVIISNRVLHWIEDKTQTMRNIHRLLKKGGLLYANITTLWDLFQDISPEEREKYEEIIHIPSEKEQIQQFRQLLDVNQFQTVTIESSHLRQLYPKEDFLTMLLPYFPNLTKKYLLERDPVKRNKIMAAGLYDYIKQAFLRLYCREVPSDENVNSTKFELTYGQIRIVAQK